MVCSGVVRMWTLSWSSDMRLFGSLCSWRFCCLSSWSLVWRYVALLLFCYVLASDALILGYAVVCRGCSVVCSWRPCVGVVVMSGWCARGMVRVGGALGPWVCV